MPKKVHKLKYGVRVSREEGCVVQNDYVGVEKPTPGKLHGYEKRDELDLTLAQLARLSEVHAECVPSLPCLAEVLKYKPSDDEEDKALKKVNKLRKEKGMKDFGEDDNRDPNLIDELALPGKKPEKNPNNKQG